MDSIRFFCPISRFMVSAPLCSSERRRRLAALTRSTSALVGRLRRGCASALRASSMGRTRSAATVGCGGGAGLQWDQVLKGVLASYEFVSLPPFRRLLCPRLRRPLGRLGHNRRSLNRKRIPDQKYHRNGDQSDSHNDGGHHGRGQRHSANEGQNDTAFPPNRLAHHF